LPSLEQKNRRKKKKEGRATRRQGIKVPKARGEGEGNSLTDSFCKAHHSSRGPRNPAGKGKGKVFKKAGSHLTLKKDDGGELNSGS